MKKNLLYLFLLIGLSVSAKNFANYDPNFEIKLKNEDNSSSTSSVNTCQLNVTIGGTLDMPTSTFFVGEEALNGTAPYTYLLDGNPSPNGNMFYTATLNPGIHTVTVQDANGCSGTGTFYVDGLSTADFVLPNFKLYPNPVKNLVTISNSSTIDEIAFVSVKGDVVLTKQINSLNSEIDLSNFSKGIYFLKIKSEGKEKTVKFIKE